VQDADGDCVEGQPVDEVECAIDRVDSPDELRGRRLHEGRTDAATGSAASSIARPSVLLAEQPVSRETCGYDVGYQPLAGEVDISDQCVALFRLPAYIELSAEPRADEIGCLRSRVDRHLLNLSQLVVGHSVSYTIHDSSVRAVPDLRMRGIYGR
jgi:hypothetical protein